jgi:hypothetical protein
MKSNNVEPTTALIGCAKMQQQFLVLAMGAFGPVANN